jgi:N utilization substance protein B
LCLLERQPELSVEQGLHLYFKHLASSEVDAEEGQQRRFAEGLVRGAHGARGAIDRLIGHCSRNWRLERMSWVDRNLLRLACFELSERSDTPARVVLNEAIEIARRYSTTESSGFVNGVLDRVLRELEKTNPQATSVLSSGEQLSEPR